LAFCWIWPYSAIFFAWSGLNLALVLIWLTYTRYIATLMLVYYLVTPLVTTFLVAHTHYVRICLFIIRCTHNSLCCIVPLLLVNSYSLHYIVSFASSLLSLSYFVLHRVHSSFIIRCTHDEDERPLAIACTWHVRPKGLGLSEKISRCSWIFMKRELFCLKLMLKKDVLLIKIGLTFV
jgi:hypothetical protein